MQALTNQELISLARDYKIKNLSGVYFKDDLPDQLIDNTYYIVNIQPKNEGSGTHWTVFYYNNNRSLYYDSFGFMCPDEVVRKIEPYMYNMRTIQSIDSSACGYYCLSFMVMTHTCTDKLRAYDAFVNLFNTNTNKNERILSEILQLP